MSRPVFKSRPDSRNETQIAYDILRGDYFRLSRELEYYRSGKDREKLVAAHEKEMRSLKYQLDQERRYSRKLKDTISSQKDEIDRLRDTVSEKQIEADRLYEEYQKKISDFEKLIGEMEKKIKDLEDRNGKLMAQITRDFESSSIPSSECRNRKTITNSRVKSSLKQGGQTGHKGHSRKRYESDVVIDLDIPAKVKDDPKRYIDSGEYKERDLVDLKIFVEVKRYRSKIFIDKKTGSRIHTPFPEGLLNETNYGKNIKAFAVLLNNYTNVPVRKVKETIELISDGRISLSTGMIASLTKGFSSNSADDVSGIFSELSASPYLHSDATHIRNSGKQEYVYITSNGKDILYQHREKKGYEGLKGTPVEHYLFTLIHDHDRCYFAYGSAHQKCLAHEIRYTEDSIRNEADLTWNIKMKQLLQDTIHRFKKKTLSDDDITKIRKDYDDIILLGEKEYKANPANRYYPEGYNTFRRFRDYKEAVLYFLDHPEIPYTNNEAEQGLRKIKRKFRIAGSFRSKEAIIRYCDFMSVIETARKKEMNIFEIIRDKV